MVETATAPVLKPLSDAERKKLDEFLARASAEASPHAPALRTGRAYVALTNLALPRRGDPDHKTDLVMRGETIYLNDEEAATFLRHGDRDGRRIAVIRLKSEVDQNALPRPTPQLLTGPIFRASAPAPGTDGPRPDLPGSSRILEDNSVPESQPAQVAQGGSPSIVDAMDIVPGTGQQARNDIMGGADQDLLAAVKQQSGVGGKTPNDGRR